MWERGHTWWQGLGSKPWGPNWGYPPGKSWREKGNVNHMVFNREKVVSDLGLQGRLWWTPLHATLISLRLSCEHVQHAAPWLPISLSQLQQQNRPCFHVSVHLKHGINKDPRPSGDQEHPWILNHTFICDHDCLPPPKCRASRTTGSSRSWIDKTHIQQVGWASSF